MYSPTFSSSSPTMTLDSPISACSRVGASATRRSISSAYRSARRADCVSSLSSTWAGSTVVSPSPQRITSARTAALAFTMRVLPPCVWHTVPRRWASRWQRPPRLAGRTPRATSRHRGRVDHEAPRLDGLHGIARRGHPLTLPLARERGRVEVGLEQPEAHAQGRRRADHRGRGEARRVGLAVRGAPLQDHRGWIRRGAVLVAEAVGERARGRGQVPRCRPHEVAGGVRALRGRGHQGSQSCAPTEAVRRSCAPTAFARWSCAPTVPGPASPPSSPVAVEKPPAVAARLIAAAAEPVTPATTAPAPASPTLRPRLPLTDPEDPPIPARVRLDPVATLPPLDLLPTPA